MLPLTIILVSVFHYTATHSLYLHACYIFTSVIVLMTNLVNTLCLVNISSCSFIMLIIKVL